MKHFNNLTPAQLERVAMLLEECGEVVQICGKVLRHGLESTHPDGGPNNLALLEKEASDVRAIIQLMVHAGDFDEDKMGDNIVEKHLKLEHYCHHNKHLLIDLY